MITAQISFDNSFWQTVKPNGLANVVISKEKQEGYVFYRDSLKATLIFIGEDYKWIKSAEATYCCKKMYIRLIDGCSQHLITAYTGINEGAFDGTTKTVSFSNWSTKDPYSYIFDNWDYEINLANYPSLDSPQGDMILLRPNYLPITFKRGKDFMGSMLHLFQVTLNQALSPVYLGIQSETSKFFTQNINPVTNLPNSYEKMLLWPTSENLREYEAFIAGYTLPIEQATRQYITLKTFLNELYALFRVAWAFDEEKNIFVVEHESYFPSYSYPYQTQTPTNTYLDYSKTHKAYTSDLTKLKAGRSLVMAQNNAINAKYNPQNYESDSYTRPNTGYIEEFGAISLKYKGDCVPVIGGKTLEYEALSSSVFVTDLDSLFVDLNGDVRNDSLARTGWTLASRRTDNNFGTGYDRYNNKLNVPSLFTNFHTYKMQFGEGEITTKGSLLATNKVIATKVEPTIALGACILTACCGNNLPNDRNNFVNFKDSIGILERYDYNPNKKEVTVYIKTQSPCTPSSSVGTCIPRLISSDSEWTVGTDGYPQIIFTNTYLKADCSIEVIKS